MSQRNEMVEIWPATMSRRFWIIASLFYAGAYGAHLAFVLNGHCGFVFIPAGQPFYGAMMVGLLLFEWWVYRRYRTRMSRRTGTILLVAHMVLFEIAVAIDCAATTGFLYFLLPFMAYLLVGKRTAIGLALLYTGWFVLYFWIFRTDSVGEFLLRAVIFGLSMLFSLVMASVVKEVLVRQAEERRLYTELQQAHQQLESYAAQLKKLGAYEERNRLARDIHDSVGHYLAVVAVQLEKALVFRLSEPVTSERAIVDAQQAAREALREVRRSVGALRQSTAPFSLTAALQDLVRRSDSAELAIALTIEGEEQGHAPATLTTLYRVAQEALTNVRRHAGASQVTVTLRMDPDAAVLRVEDNGTGFDFGVLAQAEGSASYAHQGLQGMRERLDLIGGQLQIESKPGRGTQLTASVPRTVQSPSLQASPEPLQRSTLEEGNG